ncbi:MAG TPA: ABC transporter permease [Actinomycetota bacterium]|nr:ABC transporter permease [Actinomycetota bacterium]
MIARPRPRPLPHELSALAAIAQRDLTKLLRDRVRLAVSLALPVALILGIGNILQPTVGKVTGLNSVTLAFVGVLSATLFQSSAAGMLSIVEDRDTDFSRELFVTPVSRLTLVAGKMAGETLVALAQGVCIVVFARLIGVSIGGGQLGALVLPCLASCLLGAAFGLAALSALPNQRSAMQVFEFLILPQYVLAGVLVPLRGLPAWVGVLSWAMPLRYPVGLTQAAFYAGRPGYHEVVTASPLLDVAVIVALFAVMVAVGTAVLNYRERAR